MADVSYVDGLQLWVWDTGELEGFAVFLNGQVITNQVIEGAKINVERPIDKAQLNGCYAGMEAKWSDVSAAAKSFVDSTNVYYTLSKKDAPGGLCKAGAAEPKAIADAKKALDDAKASASTASGTVDEKQ